MNNNFLYSKITDLIISSYYKVYNSLGYGFLEKVYENALMIELRKTGLFCERQVPIHVYYESIKIGNYIADIVADNSVIIEIKAAECLCKEHEAQLTNYLKATDKEVGILLNFGKKPEIKRKVFSAVYKNHNKS